MTFNELWGKSTPNSWARVPRGPAAVAVGSFLFGSTGVMAATTIAGVSLATIGGFLVTTAVTSWALSALTPKPPGTSSQTLGNVKEAVGDFDIVYGEIRKGGTVTFMETSDRHGYKVFKDDYLHMVIVLAGHEVAEIGDVYFNDEKVTLDTNGFATGNRWKSLARVKKHLGSPNQLADPDLVAETSVDSNFRGRGIAYLYVRLDWDKDVFANGIPTITAMVKGRKVYDPRSGNTVWTDNAALCIRDYLAQPFGLNSAESPSSLGSSDWVTAANVCDTLVVKKDTSPEKRYTLNGVVSTANTPRTNLQNMLTSCGGTLFWGQGQWQFKVGYFPSGPYVSFNADDLRSGISLVTKNSRKENFNAVTGTFLDREQDYIEVDYPKVESTVFLERDNNQTNTLDMSLPYTTSSSSAQRLAKMALFRSREEIIISADFGLKAAKVKVGDVIQFTFDRYGFEGKHFEVVSWKPTTNSGELKINLTLRETSAAAYDWNAEEKDILGNDTNLPDPTSGLTITNLSVTNRQTLQSDGSLLGEVVLAWDEADSAFIDKYVVQWKRSSDISWSATETDEVSLVIPSIKSGAAYNYRVKAVNFAGFSGPWEQISATVTGKDTPPGIPTNPQTDNLTKAVEVTWTNPTDKDLNHVEIHANTTNSTSGATLVGKVNGTNFIHNFTAGESRWYFLRAVDHSGNRSGFTTGVQGTALFIEQSDVDIDVGQLLDDAGLSAVEVLPSLPTTGNFDGRTVYDTTDRQLYIYDSVTGTWKPAVETFNPDDLVLDMSNFPADLKPIEIVSSLPTTGNFEGRVVMLLGDGKIYRYKGGAFTASVPTVDLVGQVSSAQIADNAINTAKFASGLRPVEVVSTLPTTGNVNGRTVVLTTDGKLYRYHSGTWTASVPTADLTGQVTSTQITDNAITTNKISSNAITSDKIEANAITTAKIAAGAITASEIAAGSIVASKLAIADFTNLVPDDQIQDASAWITTGNGGWTHQPTTPRADIRSVGNWLYVNANHTAAGDSSCYTKGFFPVTPGDVLFVSGQMIRSGGTKMRVLCQIIYYDKNDAVISGGSVTFASVNGTTNTAADYVGQLTVPAGAMQARFRFYVYKADTDGNVYFASPTVRIKNKGELIVDGAITTNKLSASAVVADKIASNAITADKIEANAITSDKIEANAITTGKIAAGAVTATAIAANTITAEKMIADSITSRELKAGSVTTNHITANAITAGIIAAGAVSAAAIQSNAVTADKINVNSLSAISANLGSITGGSINIGSGKFVVDSSGEATIRSGTSGERLVINNNRIDVYDSSGTLRVRLGQL